jgi:hypothetical protein
VTRDFVRDTYFERGSHYRIRGVIGGSEWGSNPPSLSEDNDRGFEVEPICGRERSGSPQAKSRAKSRELLSWRKRMGVEPIIAIEDNDRRF